MSFGGKVALVTGSAGGIGRATVLAVAREGAQVVVADAVLGLSRSAAVDFGRQGVRVNVLHPGTTETEMMTAAAQALLDKGVDIMPELTGRNPLDRLATNREQANAAVWLSSDQASYANGVSLVMDGGSTVLR